MVCKPASSTLCSRDKISLCEGQKSVWLVWDVGFSCSGTIHNHQCPHLFIQMEKLRQQLKNTQGHTPQS